MALDYQFFVLCHQKFEAGEELWQRSIVAPFTLLEVELEILLHTIKLCQAAFCKAPECFDTVDVDRFFRKMSGFVDAEVFVVPHIHQSVIAFPAVGMDNTLRRNLAPDDGLKRFGRAVRDQLCVNGSITLIDAEDRLFKRAPSPFSGAWPLTNPGGAKKTFINLNHTEYLLFFGYLVEINQPPEGQKVPIHGFSVQLQEQSGSGSVNVDAKAFNDFSDFIST